MCEQTEINYLDGDIVWVKLGACWWPGQVIGLHNLPEDMQAELQKKHLIAVVKFFQEDTYEFVKNYQQIYKYNCTLKDDFIRKGLDKYRSKSKDGTSYMDKFPGDVEMAEKLTDGDPDILNNEKFCPEEKPDISALFGEKKIPKRKRDREDLNRRSDGSEIMKKITHPRFLRGESDHEIRIRQQPGSLPSTPTNTGSPQYPCHICGFTSSRVNVIICHLKIHRSGDSPSPQSKVKTYSQSHSKIPDTSTPKRKYVRKEKSQSSKKKSDGEGEPRKRKHVKQSEKTGKKKKTDPELREKLLADWDDESEEEMSINLNNSLNSTINSSSTKDQSSVNISQEFNEEGDVTADNNEIIAETEKLLKETEGLSSIHMSKESLDNLSASTSLRLSSFNKKSESEKDHKVDAVSSEVSKKSPKKNTSSSDNDNKNVSVKDDKKSRLSCFDFDEDDLAEPSLPVRKIPRVFGEKNLSLKKEIIKEFEMSQALKNEIKKDIDKSAEFDKNTEFKTDEIMEIIQGSEHLLEKKETKVDEKADADVQSKMEVQQSEDKVEKKAVQQVEDKLEKKAAPQVEDKVEKKAVPSEEDDQRKSNSSVYKSEVNVAEIIGIETENDQTNCATNIKNNETQVKLTSPKMPAKFDEVSEKKSEMSTDAMKTNDDVSFQSEKTDSDNVIVESNENTSTKEADDTLSERFTTETEDETVSESAETMPEQSENSDVDIDQGQSADDSLSGSHASQPIIKRGRGRPRKNSKTTNRIGSVDKSPKGGKGKGNKRPRISEKIEFERKTSDSDTDRSYSGRKRKPNKKYLESNIYFQDYDYKAVRTDESLSESDDRVSEKSASKSRRSRRPKATENKGSDLVTQMDKQEIEITDQMPTVTENNVTILSSVDTKSKTLESKASQEETLTENFQEKIAEEVKCDVSGELLKSLDEAATAKVNTDVLLDDVEMPTVPEATGKTDEVKIDVGKTVDKSLEKEDFVKQNKSIEEDIKDEGKLTPIIQQVENKSEIQRDSSKTSMDMLPPKKSQIKKFELSQIDFFDTDAMMTNKTAQVESESKVEPESNIESNFQIEPELKVESESKIESGSMVECELNIESESKIDHESKIEPEPQPELKTDDVGKINEDEMEIKLTMGKITDEIAKSLDIEHKEQVPANNFEVESPKKSKKLEIEKETQLEEILQKTGGDAQPELKTPEESISTDKPNNTKDIPKSPTKVTVEQPLTPKRSSMQTRYKGKFTPETGAKGKKDKDQLLDDASKPVNTFQEAFLKTLHMDKKKAEESETPKGKKGKKATKKKVEEVDMNIVMAAIAPSPIVDESKKDMQVFDNVEMVVEQKLEIDTKIGESVFTTTDQLGTSPDKFVIVTKPPLQSPVSENNANNIPDVKKEEVSKVTPVPTSSLSPSDISVPVKKREMPRIIENVTLTEPMQILKSKLLDKLPQKGVKHKLESESKKGDSKSGSKAAKIMKIETMSSNSKAKGSARSSSSSHASLTKKLQVLKTEETDALLEAQKREKSTEQATDKYVQQSSQSLTEMELDINSMPFVISDEVLTPESIEQMPVVISSIIPASSSIPATLSFTPTTQIVSPTVQTTQFKIKKEAAMETVSSSTKKKSGVPAILKNKKARPTITSVKTLVPPLTGGVKGLKFQTAQPAGNTTSPLLTQKGTTQGKYVVVQTAGGQQLRYSVQGKAGTQQKIAIPTGKATAGNAQVVQQGSKVVILTSAQSCQTKMLPLNISKTLGGKVQRIVTSKGQVLCPISPQGGIITSKAILAPKTDAAGSPTTSKLAGTGHKILNTQSIITSKAVLTPITGKTTLLGTLAQGILTKNIYTPISGSTLSGKALIGPKVVTKGTTLLSPQSLSGTKAILTPVTQTIAGKTILNTQAIVGSKGTVLTPITGQQVKAIAAKSPSKANKALQYQQVQQKMQLQPLMQKSSKVPISSASPQSRASATGKSPSSSTLVLHNTQKSQSKKMAKQSVVQSTAAIQSIASPSGAQQTVAIVSQQQAQSKSGKGTANVQKIVIPRSGGRQTKAQQKLMMQKMQDPMVSTMQGVHAKQVITTSTNVPITGKTAVHSKQTSTTKSSTKSHSSKLHSQAQKNLLNVAVNSIGTATTNANIITTLTIPSLEPIDTEKKAKADLQLVDAGQKEAGKVEKIQTEKSVDAADKTEELKVTQPQIMALPTESSDGTQTYVLVTIDEQGQIQPLDNNTLMSLEGTTQNQDGTRTLYIDPSSLGETAGLDNIVLQFDNGILPNIQSNVTTEPSPTIIPESFPTSEVIQTSNQDILAAALANTDFQQEITLPENQTGSVMTTGLTQASLINRTILQSTIIPPTQPISSPSVLETSLTLNQPIMTPLEVPSNLPIQSDSTPTSSTVVSTIPTSLELPITITNPTISYISSGEAQIQIPANSMPDIGEIMESPVGASAEIDRTEEISVNTQYLVIPNLEDNIAVAAAAETQNVQNTEIAIPSASYSVTMPSSMVLDSSQVQTTPSMPIIDDTYTDNNQFVAGTSIVAEQTFADVPVSEMLVSKASVSVENVQSQDITVTSEMIVSSHQVPTSPQKPIISTDESKNLDKGRAVTMQEVYSSHEVPITSEELILQQPIKEVSASSSSTMEVVQEAETAKEKKDISMTDCLPMIDEITMVTSESTSRIEPIEQQVVATSNEVEPTSQILPPESLKPSNDTEMEVDGEVVQSEQLYAGSSTTRHSADCQRDKPTSQEETDRRRLRENVELHFEEEMSTGVASQETPSQSQYEQLSSVTSDSADLPSQSAAKSSESTVEATQSSTIAYEPMETDEEEAIVTEPPTQSFEHSKVNEASQSYEISTETNVNAPTQSFNEIMQSQEDRPSADEMVDDQSFPTQSYKVDKGDNVPENLETDAEISQEGNVPSQSNDIGVDGIGTSSVSTNNSGLNEDETASSSYVPETPENQERDQEDQESAISTSSYEIPPCEELNIASSSVIPDTSVSAEHSSINDNGVPEIPTSSYNLNPDITSTHVDSGPTSSYEDQVIVEQNVSTSYEVPISMPGMDETCSQNFVTESTDHRNEPSSYYAHHQEVTASYYEPVDQDANSRLEGGDPHEEVTPGYYEGNPQEVSQSYFAPAEETPNYTSHSISPSYYERQSEASQSYYSTDELDKTEQSSSPNIEASQSFYQERSGDLGLRQQGEATPTYTEGYPVDYTLENSPIERHDLVESSVPATRPMER